MSDIPDRQLVWHLCNKSAIFSLDCLLEDGGETLHEVCNRLPWIVRPADRFAGHFFPSGIKLDAHHPAWTLNAASVTARRQYGLILLWSRVQYFSTRRKTDI